MLAPIHAVSSVVTTVLLFKHQINTGTKTGAGDCNQLLLVGCFQLGAGGRNQLLEALCHWLGMRVGMVSRCIALVETSAVASGGIALWSSTETSKAGQGATSALVAFAVLDLL